ncbi:MAG: CbiX/SirB N-terminal domain-containing protein [Clostridiales bacterium]|nr:CbiX/SirB N-terminal domain-containing protein [Clostridiales bacterium]
MKGILILAHGSREKSTEDTLKEIVKMLKGIMKDHIIESAFLQFCDTDLHAGLDKLKAQGVDEIKVVPYFLFEGVHIREDIPKEIDEYLENNKDIKITLGKTLGSDRRLAEILADRVREAL